MTEGFDLDEIERLLAAATPGVWVRHNNPKKWVSTLAPVTTDEWCANCDNDALCVIALHNSAPAMITEIRELRAENARLKEANGILEDGLQEVGDDYPGSSCQEWCQHQIKQARAALGEPQ